ncbi:unnamed protein product [Closterium sp. NIES-54]
MPRCPSACTASAATTATATTAATAASATMASPTVLTFDAEGRAVDFDVWVDDLQLFLQCDSRDGVSLFDHTSGVSTALAATADSTVCSQWTTRDAVARLAVCSHLPPAERAHFGQYKTAHSLYDAVVVRYSSPATAALSRLMLPYLFPDLAAFATVADLIAHLRTNDARYRAALPTEDHFLSLCPTELTDDLLEERLAAAEKSILAEVLLAATVAPLSLRGVPLSPFSPLLLLLLLSTSLALRRSELRLPLVGGAAPARARGARVVEGTAGAAAEAVEEAEGVAVEVGVAPGVGASVAAVEVVEAAAEVVEAAAAVVEAAAVVVEVVAAVVLVEVQPRSMEALVVASASSSRVPVRPRRPSSFMSGTLGVGGLGFPDAVELPRWHDLLRQNVAIFYLDFDAILAAMYALTDSAEGDCYLSVPNDPGIEAAALGASASAAPGTGESAAPGAGESALSGTAPTEALHTFTLNSGATCSFFRDSTTLTPLSRPVAVSLADPSGGQVLAHSSTILPCPAAPSGLLLGHRLPSFSTNLVSGADLQDAWVDQFTPGGQRVTHCTCSRTGRHLATFTRRPGSSLYTLTTVPPPVSASGQVAASTQRAAPHSFTFPSTNAPLQTLHMDVWGPARVHGQGHERYFLLVVDNYSRYTTVFPLRSKGEVTETFTLPASPQQNGIAERRIGMVVDVPYTSMIHAAAPHFLWPFAVQYVAHQINLQPRVSLTETTPTLRWTGKVGDASAFRVWGSRAFVRDTSADKLSSRAVPCFFLGFPPDAPGWQFYHPTSRRILSSQDVTFDKLVSYYHLIPYRTALLPPPPLFLAPGTPPVDPLPPHGPAPSGVSQVDPAEPVEVAVDSGAARGFEPAGSGTGGAEPGGTASWGAEPERVESGGAEPERVEPGGAEPWGIASWGAEPASAVSGGSLGASLRREPLSLQRLREWYARRCRRATRAQTGAQNKAHCSALLPCSRVAAAWPASSCLRGLSGQHC